VEKAQNSRGKEEESCQMSRVTEIADDRNGCLTAVRIVFYANMGVTVQRNVPLKRASVLDE